MNTYKITNTTNTVGKRDPKYNSVAHIEYVDNRTKKIIALKAGESVFLTVSALPLSVHRLRIKKLVDIVEVSPAELQKSIEATKPKPVKKPASKKTAPVKETVVVEETVESVEDKKSRTPRKKTTE